MRIYNVICLTVFLFATASAVQPADAGVECVRVEVTSPGSGDIHAGVRLTNKCGKDITAFHLVFREPDGSEAGAASQELLGLLVLSPPSPDIFRKDTSRIFRDVWFGNAAVPSVTATMFADRSTLGDPVHVASLVKSRAEALQRFQEQLSALDSVSDWNDALGLRRRAEEVKPRNYALGRYLEHLAERHERSNLSSWEVFVAQQRKMLIRVIELFEFHLGKRTELTGDRP